MRQPGLRAVAAQAEKQRGEAGRRAVAVTTYTLAIILCWSVPLPADLTGWAGTSSVCYAWRTHDDRTYPTLDACEAAGRWWLGTQVMRQQTTWMSLGHGGAPERVVTRCERRVVM